MLTKLRFNFSFPKLLGIRGLVQRENRKAYKETSVLFRISSTVSHGCFQIRQDKLSSFFFFREGTNFVLSVL